VITYTRKRDRVLWRTFEDTRVRLDFQPPETGMLLVAEGPKEAFIWQVLDNLGDLRSEEVIVEPEDTIKEVERQMSRPKSSGSRPSRRPHRVSATPKAGTPIRTTGFARGGGWLPLDGGRPLLADTP
jgi:hypothetical protein